MKHRRVYHTTPICGKEATSVALVGLVFRKWVRQAKKRVDIENTARGCSCLLCLLARPPPVNCWATVAAGTRGSAESGAWLNFGEIFTKSKFNRDFGEFLFCQMEFAIDDKNFIGIIWQFIEVLVNLSLVMVQCSFDVESDNKCEAGGTLMAWEDRQIIVSTFLITCFWVLEYSLKYFPFSLKASLNLSLVTSIQEWEWLTG